MPRPERRFRRRAAALLVLAGVVVPGAAALAATPQALATQAGCAACHLPDKKLIGPSYRDIAAKNKGKADAPARLAAAVRKGSKDVWGPVPMPPTPPAKLADADLKALIDWVLKTP